LQDPAGRFAAEFVASREDGFADLLGALFESSAAVNDPGLPIRVGARLRDDESYELADRLFSQLVDVPALRADALWELGYSRIRQGKLGDALRPLSEWDAESGLPTWRRIHLATLHARLGDLAKAHDILNEISLVEPGIKSECMAEAQLYKMLRRFPRAEADRMLSELQSRFAPSSAQLVEEDVLGHLRGRTPYLMLRMGDGEGACIKLNLDDEQEFALLYRQNRRDFTQIWFGDREIVGDSAFEAALDEFNGLIQVADCFGAFSAAAVEFAYRTGSGRDVAWVVNTMRKVLEAADRDPGWASRTRVDTLSVHYDLLTSGALERILAAAPRVGLVSCHADLPAALMGRFGLGEVEFHKVPGEKAHSSVLGDAAVEGRHWPTRFSELSAIFDRGDRHGQLFLVAAGFLGKIYAAKLKKSGAVVLDIGAVADLLMGKETRTFPEAVRPHVLVGAGENGPPASQTELFNAAPGSEPRHGWVRRIGAALLRTSKGAVR
jgi:hypothetical protein